MKQFTFSLEALLKKREREENEMKLELALQSTRIYAAKEELYTLKTELQNLQENEKLNRTLGTTLLTLKFSVSYRNKLKLDMLHKGKEITLYQNQIVIIRQRLIHATKLKKALELLREKKFKQWEKDYKHREQVFIDDVCQQRFIRMQGDREKISHL